MSRSAYVLQLRVAIAHMAACLRIHSAPSHLQALIIYLSIHLSSHASIHLLTKERENPSQQIYAPATLLSLNSHLSSCKPFKASLPSSVNSGLPSGEVAPTKNLGVHSVPASSRSLAFSRCRSSSSCLSAVAREYCREVMASVTEDQKRRDSLGSWAAGGGRSLGATDKGARSIRRVCAS